MVNRKLFKKRKKEKYLRKSKIEKEAIFFKKKEQAKKKTGVFEKISNIRYNWHNCLEKRGYKYVVQLVLSFKEKKEKK